jgi:hypothetical protein
MIDPDLLQHANNIGQKFTAPFFIVPVMIDEKERPFPIRQDAMAHWKFRHSREIADLDRVEERKGMFKVSIGSFSGNTTKLIN